MDNGDPRVAVAFVGPGITRNARARHVTLADSLP